MMPWHTLAAMINCFLSVKHCHQLAQALLEHQVQVLPEALQVQVLPVSQVQLQGLPSLAEVDFAVLEMNAAHLFATILLSSPASLQATGNKYCAVSSTFHPWFRTKYAERHATTLSRTTAAMTSCSPLTNHCLPVAEELLRQFLDAEMVLAMLAKDAAKMLAITSQTPFALYHPTLRNRYFATLVKHLECSLLATLPATILLRAFAATMCSIRLVNSQTAEP
jgi:hypothetical protein